MYGVDGRARLTPNDEVVFQFLGTSTRYDPSTAARFGQPEGTFGDNALSGGFTQSIAVLVTCPVS